MMYVHCVGKLSMRLELTEKLALEAEPLLHFRLKHVCLKVFPNTVLLDGLVPQLCNRCRENIKTK